MMTAITRALDLLHYTELRDSRVHEVLSLVHYWVLESLRNAEIGILKFSSFTSHTVAF